MNEITKIRTVPKAVAVLKEIDPGTAITVSAVRRAIREGKISSVQVGTRNLVNVNEIALYFGGEDDDFGKA